MHDFEGFSVEFLADRVVDVLGITMEKLIETFPVEGKSMWAHLRDPS